MRTRALVPRYWMKHTTILPFREWKSVDNRGLCICYTMPVRIIDQVYMGKISKLWSASWFTETAVSLCNAFHNARSALSRGRESRDFSAARYRATGRALHNLSSAPVPSHGRASRVLEIRKILLAFISGRLTWIRGLRRLQREKLLFPWRRERWKRAQTNQRILRERTPQPPPLFSLFLPRTLFAWIYSRIAFVVRLFFNSEVNALSFTRAYLVFRNYLVIF